MNIKKFGKYEVIDILGEGGMGVVYKGVDPRIGRPVAIKLMTSGFSKNEEAMRRFYREARSVGVLRHPNIVVVYDLGDQDGAPFLVMEYLEGESLDEIIRSGRLIPLASKLKVLAEVCSALGYAHKNNVIHRDVKPANVIVQPDGTAKLLDFGIAHVERLEQDAGLTGIGSVIGTAAYMAPERLRGEAFDGRSDIFSAGVMLFQFLTGELPFGRDEVAVVQKVFSEKCPPLSRFLENYPAELDPILDRALAKDPCERYAAAEDMAGDIALVAREVQRDEILQMLPQAERFLVGHEYTRAREMLLDILRIDAQHTGAKRLLSEVQKQLTQRQREESIRQLRLRADDASRDKQFDRAIGYLEDALKLDSSDLEVPRLLETVRQQKRSREQADIYLRQADVSRQIGDYEAAKAIVKKALELDKQNSNVIAAYKAIEKEAEESERKARARKIIESGRLELVSGNFETAIGLLREAGDLDPSDPELDPLLDQATRGLEQEQRRKIVNELNDEATLATTLDELQRVLKRVSEALARMPAEATLIKLNAQLQRKVNDEENRRLVEETAQACRSMDTQEAIKVVRQALHRLPGEERLLALQVTLEDRQRKRNQEEVRKGHLLQARKALDQGLYADAVEILERCQSECTSTDEIRELLVFARTEASRLEHQQFVERNCLQAQALIGDEDYDSAKAFLEAALLQSDSPEFRKLLEHAQAERQSLQQRISTVLEKVRALMAAKEFKSAKRLLESLSPAAVRDVRIQAALNEVQHADEREWDMLQLIGRAYSALAKREIGAGRVVLEEALRNCEKSDLAKRMSKAFEARQKTVADTAMQKAIEQLRAASVNGDAESAVLAVGSTVGILEYANSELRADWQRLQEQAGRQGRLARLKGKLFG